MLNLYHYFNYNLEGQAHAYFTSIAAYKIFLKDYLVTSINKNNFIITNGVVKVAADNILNNRFKEITYILDDEKEIFYFVNNVVYKSGYYEFSVEIDYWGSFINIANISNINIIKTNRNIGTGIYDNISFTKSNTSRRFALDKAEQVEGYPNNLKYSEAVIVFLLKYEKTTEGSWGSITATDMFYLDLNTINEAYTAQKGKINPVELATSFVGGIARASIPDEGLTYANVTKAYIVPKSFIEDNKVTTTINVDSYSKYGKKTLACKTFKHKVKELTKEIIINPNYDYYIGTPYDGLKIIRTNEARIKITYRITADVDELKIIVLQGGNQKDITNNFSVVLTYNEGDVTNLSGILNGLKTMTGVFTSGLKMASGDTLSGALGIGASIASGISPYLKTNVHLGQMVGSGDGYVNIIDSEGDLAKGLGLLNPLGYLTAVSNDNEEELARHYGITFNQIYNKFLNTIFSLPLIGSGNFTDTYIKADVDVTNVPLAAFNVIKQAFNNGVRLVEIK